MAHGVKRTFMIAEHPWVVQATATDLRDFLATLNAGGGGASDLALVEESEALWAVEVPYDSVEGTAYVVSHATYVYVQAHRY